jgi:phage terminase large subunit GpA-like protein
VLTELKETFKVWSPPPRLTISSWAEKFRRLSTESSAMPGMFRLSMAPYQREPMDKCMEDSCQAVVLMWGSQLGKSEIISNIISFHAHLDPSPILCVQPTLEIATSWSTDRLAPMIRDTPVLRNVFGDPKARDSNNTKLYKKFTGGFITVAGANSPASLAARPIRVLALDEVDRYPASAGTEGDPVLLAQKRTETFFNSVQILTSTPTLKHLSRIESEFQLTDQRRWFCPCPHCGQYQVLSWAQVKWDKDKDGKHLPETARMVCEKCEKDISDEQRREMVSQGEWRGTAPFTGKHGYHINGLVSLFPPKRGYKNRMHQAVAQFLDAKHLSVFGLQAWTNTFLAETWEQVGSTVESSPLLARCEPFEAQVPNPVVVLTAGIDCQDDRLEAECVGWCTGEECYGISAKVFYGQITNPATWAQLDEWLSQSWEHESGVSLRIASAMIDTGYQSKIVYDFCKPREVRRVFAVKGVGGVRPIVSRPNRGNSANVALFSIGTDSAKELLYSRLKIEEPGPGYCHFPIDPGYDAEFFDQLTAEKAVTKIKAGVKSRVWVKKRARNESLDCRIYALSAFVNLNANLDQLAKSLKSKTVNESKSEERPRKDPLQAIMRPPRNTGFVNSWKT